MTTDNEAIESAISSWLIWKSGGRRIVDDKGVEQIVTPDPLGRPTPPDDGEWAAYYFRCVPRAEWSPDIRDDILVDLPAALRADIESGVMPCPAHLVERTIARLGQIVRGEA